MVKGLWDFGVQTKARIGAVNFRDRHQVRLKLPFEGHPHRDETHRHPKEQLRRIIVILRNCLFRCTFHAEGSAREAERRASQ